MLGAAGADGRLVNGQGEACPRAAAANGLSGLEQHPCGALLHGGKTAFDALCPTAVPLLVRQHRVSGLRRPLIAHATTLAQMVRARRSSVACRQRVDQVTAVMVVMLTVLPYVGCAAARQLQASQVRDYASWLCRACASCGARLSSQCESPTHRRCRRRRRARGPGCRGQCYLLLTGARHGHRLFRTVASSSWRARTPHSWRPAAATPWASSTRSSAQRWPALSRAASSASGRSPCAAAAGGDGLQHEHGCGPARTLRCALSLLDCVKVGHTCAARYAQQCMVRSTARGTSAVTGTLLRPTTAHKQNAWQSWRPAYKYCMLEAAGVFVCRSPAGGLRGLRMQGRQRHTAMPTRLRQVAVGRDVVHALQPRMVCAGTRRLSVQTVPRRLRLEPGLHRLRCVPSFPQGPTKLFVVQVVSSTWPRLKPGIMYTVPNGSDDTCSIRIRACIRLYGVPAADCGRLDATSLSTGSNHHMMQRAWAAQL